MKIEVISIPELTMECPDEKLQEVLENQKFDDDKFYLIKSEAKIDFSYLNSRLDFIIERAAPFDIIQFTPKDELSELQIMRPTVYAPNYEDHNLHKSFQLQAFSGKLIRKVFERLIQDIPVAFITSTLITPIAYKRSVGVLIDSSPVELPKVGFELPEVTKSEIYEFHRPFLIDPSLVIEEFTRCKTI